MIQVMNKWIKWDDLTRSNQRFYELSDGRIVVGYHNLMKVLEELNGQEETKRKGGRTVTRQQSKSKVSD